MKTVITLVLSLIGFVSLYSQKQVNNLVQSAVIVEGRFFDKSVSPESLMPGGSTITILKAPDGATVLGVYLPEGYIWDGTMDSKAIPAEKVKYARQLLRDYDAHRPHKVSQYEGIGVEAGQPMVSFEYQDIDGKVWNNEILKNKVYVINIWQSECGPCRREMPTLSAWKDRFNDVVFLSASRHTKDEILPIVSRYNFNWTHLQEAKDLVSLVGQQGFPLTIVVDKDGIVRFAKVGAGEQNQKDALSIIEGLAK